MLIRKYDRKKDEDKLMSMIAAEEDWDYAEGYLTDNYKRALEACITYVAYEEDVLCAFSRSIDDFGFDLYVFDLLVDPRYRGRAIGRKLVECLQQDYPD